LCVQGNWPAHAWFTAYAPYDDPEIIIIAFVYNGGEGSAVALPMVVQTMEAYYRLQNERGQSTLEGIPPASEDLPEGALPTGDLPLVPELPTNGIVPQATPDVSPAGQ
jgi:hypothetical protein